MQPRRPIQLISDKQENSVPGAIRSARWLFSFALVLAALIPVGMWIMNNVGNPIPTDMLHLLMLLQAFVGVLMLAYAGLRWHRAKRNQGRYLGTTLMHWTFRCDDIECAWDVSGFDACEGWREVGVLCRRLPKRRGKVLAVPQLKVSITNEDSELASGKISQSGKIDRIGIIDGEGKPMRIMISHVKPEDASTDQPWEVEITLFGDPTPPTTLSATPLDLSVGEVSHA